MDDASHQECYLRNHFSSQELQSILGELKGNENDKRNIPLQLRALCRSLGGVTILLKGSDAVEILSTLQFKNSSICCQVVKTL